MKRILSSLFAIFFLVLIFWSNTGLAQANYTVTRFDYAWCTASYPTSFVDANFSITELNTAVGGNNGFSKTQPNNTTLQIDLPTGFEFNAVASCSVAPTVTQSGSPVELTAITFTLSSVGGVLKRLTVTATVANTNNVITSMDFNNFQIRCNASGSSGNILRTGGTFQIDNATTNPTASEPLGILSAGTPYVYTSSAVTQPNVSNVTQFSINQDIIQIKISGTGNCNSTVSQFIFNTDGSNATGTDLPATNITTAKVYFTGSSSTFATTGYFGQVASPNGSFTITGSQDLTTVDSYFWVTYDVPGSANTAAGSNKLDAQLTSFVLQGTTYSNMSTPTPVGSRTIIGATFYYSTGGGGGWNNNAHWSTVAVGGVSCTCQPNGSGVAVIGAANNITADAVRTVDVIQINTGATLTGGSKLTVNSDLITAGTGLFSLTTTLTVLGNVDLAGSGSSSCDHIIDINGDLTVGAGTTLTASGAAPGSTDQNIYVGGNLTVNGTLQQTGGKDIILDVGAAFVLGGSGTITTTRSLIMNAGSKSVPAGSNLTINSDFVINGAYTLTNNGTINLNGNLTGNNVSSKWINKGGSVLNYAGATTIFSTNGTLDAATSTNTVNYNGAAQSIKTPNNSGQYNNLTLSGTGTKTLTSDINISGAFVTNKAFVANGRNVEFNNNAAQAISGTVTPTFYDLTINNSSAAGVTLSEPANASNSLILTAGLLNTSSTNILTMQPGSTAPALTDASTSYINGPMKYQKNTLSAQTLNFPIGKSPNCRPITLTIMHTSDGPLYNYQGEMINSAADALLYTLPATVDTVSGVRYWTVDRTDAGGVSQPSAGLSGNQTIRLYFGTDDFVYQGTKLVIVKNTSAASTTWFDIGGTCSFAGNFATPQAGFVTSTSAPSTFTSFSTFTLGSLLSGWNSLPIDLLNFSALLNKGKVDLNWTTRTELNNKYFTIERSSDSQNFTELAVKNSKAPNGTSTLKLDYQLTDGSPLSGTSYYRLKQTDYNGKSKTFNVVSVYFGVEKNIVFTVYPNPNIGQFKADFTGVENNHEVQIVLNDEHGKLVYSSSFYAQEATNSVSIIPEHKISKGVYFCSLIVEGIKHTVKVIVN